MKPADIIAANLAAIPHPDGNPRQLAGFATQLLPEVMAQQVTQTARDIGDAIVHLLELNGYTISNTPPPAPTAAETSIASVYCSHCDTRVLQLNITNPTRVLSMYHYAATECPNR